MFWSITATLTTCLLIALILWRQSVDKSNKLQDAFTEVTRLHRQYLAMMEAGGWLAALGIVLDLNRLTKNARLGPTIRAHDYVDLTTLSNMANLLLYHYLYDKPYVYSSDMYYYMNVLDNTGIKLDENLVIEVRRRVRSTNTETEVSL